MNNSATFFVFLGTKSELVGKSCNLIFFKVATIFGRTTPHTLTGRFWSFPLSYEYDIEFIELKCKSSLLHLRGNQCSRRLSVSPFSGLILVGDIHAKWILSSPYMILANITLSGSVLRWNSCKSSKSSKIAIFTEEYEEERGQEETSRPTIIVEQGELYRMVCSVYHNSHSACQETPLRAQDSEKVMRFQSWGPSDKKR